MERASDLPSETPRQSPVDFSHEVPIDQPTGYKVRLRLDDPKKPEVPPSSHNNEHSNESTSLVDVHERSLAKLRRDIAKFSKAVSAVRPKSGGIVKLKLNGPKKPGVLSPSHANKNANRNITTGETFAEKPWVYGRLILKVNGLKKHGMPLSSQKHDIFQ